MLTDIEEKTVELKIEGILRDTTKILKELEELEKGLGELGARLDKLLPSKILKELKELKSGLDELGARLDRILGLQEANRQGKGSSSHDPWCTCGACLWH